MSRLTDGLNYPRGHVWREETERAISSFEGTVKLEGGVLRWASNGRVPPVELLDLWREVGKRFNYRNTVTTGKRDMDKTVAEYRRNQMRQTAEMEEEQRRNLQGAFGRGKETVDVISGRRYRT